jgi:5-formyltetrahydrofolate cyclo-ligase
VSEIADRKAAWRSWAEREARAVPAEVSDSIVQHVIDWLPFAPVGVVVSFIAMPGEVDLGSLAGRTDRALAVTRTPPPGGLLTVHPFEAPRHRHPYGFDQPVAGAEEIAAVEIGVVLVPGLVFDVRGARLGRGAGYYDRFLPTLAPTAARVGIAPSWMVVDSVPTESHDVAMTHIATERGIASSSHDDR